MDIRLKPFQADLDPVSRPCALDAIEDKIKFPLSIQPPTSLKQNNEYSLFVSHCDEREWDE